MHPNDEIPPLLSSTPTQHYQNQQATQDSLQYQRNLASIEIDTEFAKKKIAMDKELAVYERKQLLKEKHDEQKKAHHEDVVFFKDGTIAIKSFNLFIQTQPRLLSNFSKPALYLFRRIGYMEDKIYYFSCMINGEPKNIFFDYNKFGNDNYIMKKLNEIGGEILVEKSSKKKLYLRKLLNKLIESLDGESWIPDSDGWYKDIDGRIKFCDGGYTWERIAPLAK